jgi:ABC-type transporter lipoprotein component MlaA
VLRFQEETLDSTLGIAGLFDPAHGKVMLNHAFSLPLTGAQQSCEK